MSSGHSYRRSWSHGIFLQAGSSLIPPSARGRSGGKPEFYVTDGSTSAGVEVFQPREWRLLDAFTRRTSQLLVDADLPLDFGASLNLQLEHRLDEQNWLIDPHPQLLEQGLATAGAEFFAKLERELERLVPGARTAMVVARPDVNLELEVLIQDIQVARGTEPARRVGHGYSVSAYVPESIFRDTAEKVRAKAGKRQAGPPGAPHTRLLIVDLSTSPLQPHLYDDVRVELYVDLLRSVLGPAVPADYDVIALCDPSWDEGLNPRFVCLRDQHLAAALLGPVLPIVVTA